MDTEERRKRIQRMISSSAAPITGNELAAQMGVTRQVVVKDIALLRAGGSPIFATPSGYVWLDQAASQKAVRIIFCKHDTLDAAKEELMIIVKFGGTVKDVMIEHPVYGELTGSLLLRTPEAVENLIERLGRPGAKMLSAMTDGVHIHTIEAPSESILDEIENKLMKANILIS